MNDGLEFKIERCDAKGTASDILAKAGNVVVARAAFDAAVQQYPRDYLTLRIGIRVIAERPGWKMVETGRTEEE